MDFGPSFFVRRHDKMHGPFAREQLRELAAKGHVDAATEIATTAEGPWARLDAMPALRTVLTGDAPARFERANHALQPPINLREVIAAANLRRAPASGDAPSTSEPSVSAPHHVPSLLQFNLAIEKRLGQHELSPLPQRRSRRRRDYLVLMTMIGVLIFSVLVVECFIGVQVEVLAARMPDQFWPIFKAVLFQGPILAWGLAAFATFAIAFGWLIFGLTDDN